jgi:hypothetical protein
MVARRSHQASDGADGDQVGSDPRPITTPSRRQPIAPDAGTAVGFGNRPIRVRFRPFKNVAGTMLGWLRLELPSGLIVNDAKLMVGPQGHRWLALPAMLEENALWIGDVEWTPPFEADEDPDPLLDSRRTTWNRSTGTSSTRANRLRAKRGATGNERRPDRRGA